MDKQKQNQDYYSNVIYGKTCSRITIPLMKLKHIDNAIAAFQQLSKALIEIRNSKQPIHRRIGMSKTEIYFVHCDLKNKANEPYGNSGSQNDFRHCK